MTWSGRRVQVLAVVRSTNLATSRAMLRAADLGCPGPYGMVQAGSDATWTALGSAPPILFRHVRRVPYRAARVRIGGYAPLFEIVRAGGFPQGAHKPRPKIRPQFCQFVPSVPV